MKAHNTHYATLADYLKSRASVSFDELVNVFIHIRRRMKHLHHELFDSDVCSSRHDESFAALCELSEVSGFLKGSLLCVDSNFPFDLIDKVIEK